MTDKVQKIKDWISRKQDGLMDAQGNFEYPEHQGAYDVLCNLDAYIDSLQEEPVSKDFEMALAEMIDKAQKCVVEPWMVAAQWKDELIKLAKSEEPVSEQNLSNVEKTVKEWKEPVSIDFEHELYKAFGQVKDFTLGMRIAKWFYDMGKNSQQPVSEDLELTWKDMRELYIIFAEVDTEIELCKADNIKSETIGYYQEVLKRFKDLKK